MLFYHNTLLLGCAVINRGARERLVKIQTVRTSGVRPSGVSSGQSTEKRLPCADCTDTLTSCSLPCLLSAAAKTCHSFTRNPNLEKNRALLLPSDVLAQVKPWQTNF